MVRRIIKRTSVESKLYNIEDRGNSVSRLTAIWIFFQIKWKSETFNADSILLFFAPFPPLPPCRRSPVRSFFRPRQFSVHERYGKRRCRRRCSLRLVLHLACINLSSPSPLRDVQRSFFSSVYGSNFRVDTMRRDEKASTVLVNFIEKSEQCDGAFHR